MFKYLHNIRDAPLTLYTHIYRCFVFGDVVPCSACPPTPTRRTLPSSGRTACSVRATRAWRFSRYPRAIADRRRHHHRTSSVPCHYNAARGGWKMFAAQFCSHEQCAAAAVPYTERSRDSRVLVPCTRALSIKHDEPMPPHHPAHHPPYARAAIFISSAGSSLTVRFRARELFKLWPNNFNSCARSHSCRF